MLIWDDAISLAKWLATDAGTETETNAKLLMNLGYKQILARFRRGQTSDTQYTSTVANQRAYMLPPNFIRVKGDAVSFTYGGRLTPLKHVQNEELWNRLIETNQTTARPERYFIRSRFGAGGAEILLDPIPSVVGTLQLEYEANDRDLAVTKYNTGTVALTNGSTVVTGTGTTFTNAMVGRYFKINDATGDGFWYRISSYTSATVIGLEQSYDGNNVTGVSYEIAEAFALPEEMQILPVYYFLERYFAKKRNKDDKEYYNLLFRDGMSQAQRDYASKDDTARLFNVSKYATGLPVATPSHFPSEVT